MSFKDIALPTAALGIPVTPLRPNTKDAFLPGFQNSATTDPNQIEEWNRLYPNANCGAVAKSQPDGVWIFEADDPAIFNKIKSDTGHELLAEVKTYLVRSRAGRGHIYFRQTPKSMQMGNVPQAYGPFSCRQHNMYVVAAGSIHPQTLQPYTCLTPGVAPVPAPDWFVEWIMAQRNVNRAPVEEKGGQSPRTERGLIPHGYIHAFMVQHAGMLRNMGMDIPRLEETLLDVVHKNCEPPIDEDKVRQVARSFEKYDPNPAASMALQLNQRPDDNLVSAAEDVEVPVFEDAEYPQFPTYVYSNTSLYDNFVKPMCDHNSRIDYFMWLPAMALLSNYIGTKVQVKSKFAQKAINMSQYLVLIGKRGLTNKSSCVDDAISYFNYIGCLTHDGGLKTADGKTVVWTPGSAEGLGIDMQRTNCKNGVIFYDELSQLIKKAGVDGSTLSSQLLTLYESKKFGNSVKHAKEKFSLDPGTYVMSMVTCCTTETFQDLWSRLNGNDTGLNDRTMFVLEPEELPERRIKEEVNIYETATVTRQFIDRAIQQGVFEVENWNNAKLQALVPLGDRYVSRAMKWALAIAVDMGLTLVDDECVDRGCDIVRYEIKVKEFLKTYDAKNREAALQLRIRQALEMKKGEMLERDLKRVCHADREGTTAWGQAFYGLQKAGIIRVLGTGGRTDPRRVQVLIRMDTEENS